MRLITRAYGIPFIPTCTFQPPSVQLYYYCPPPHTLQEMVLALVVQMVGVLLYGYFLGAIAAVLTNVASPRYR